MRTLIIDSSTMSLSMALMEEKTLITEITTNTKIQHSAQMMPLIETMFKTVKWKPDMLQRIVVTKGPGSYTGLRIGVTAAKTLAQTLNIALYSVSSLQALAVNAEKAHHYILPFIDARRGTVYGAGYKRDNSGDWEEIGAIGHYEFGDWLSKIASLNLTDKLYFISPDSANFTAEIVHKFGAQAVIAPDSSSLIRASQLSKLPLRLEDADTFIPEYAKLAEAEENWRMQNQDKVNIAEEDYVERTN